MDLSLGFLFCSIDLYFCLCASTILSWWLWLCSRVPPGSSIHQTFQARILAWVAISYLRGSSRSRDPTGISCASCIGRQILYHCAPGKPSFLPSDSQIGITDLELLFLFVLHLSNQLSAWLLYVCAPLALQTHCVQNRIPLLYLYSVELVQLLSSNYVPGSSPWNTRINEISLFLSGWQRQLEDLDS